MGKTKKKFIDKKTAHHFYLLHRSQQDPLYHADPSEGGSKYILHPADQKTADALQSIDNSEYIKNYPAPKQGGSKAESASQSNELREVDELGLPVDGYDYTQHLAPLSGNGVFISKDGVKQKLVLPKQALASEEEYDRMLEAITLKTDKMDPELKALLELDSEDSAEVDNDVSDVTKQNSETFLDDDFMTQLIKAEEECDPEEDTFEFDKHMARLLEEADSECGSLFSEEEQEAITVERIQRDVDEHFDKLLETEYNDEDIGELDEEQVVGHFEQSNEQVINVLDEHMSKLKVESGSDNKVGDGELKVTEKECITEVLFSETKEISPEELLKESGYEPKVKSKWDCETIVSTYSTLDNHPSLIKTTNTTRRKKQNDRSEQNTTKDNSPKQDTRVYNTIVDTSVGRDKKESAEEKRMRKLLSKQNKRERRKQKKENTLLFKQEKQRIIQHNAKIKQAACAPQGVSTFKL